MIKSLFKTDTIFLDSCIFFSCIAEERCRKVIDHARNQEFTIVTSITVLGETFNEMLRDERAAVDYINEIVALMREWNVITLYPNDELSYICYEMGKDITDNRIINQITDRVHLGYAISYDCNYFVTDDDAIQRYRIPRSLEEQAGYKKPVAVDLIGLRDLIRKKKLVRK